MIPLFANHLERVLYATLEKFTVDRIPAWIEKNTYINGANYSFKDHEYQAKILSDASQVVVTRKCSQIGMSEASARFSLGLLAVNPSYTVIYTLPTATFAGDFMKSRIDPIVLGSSALRDQLDKNLDNSEIKRFGDSYLYMKGCQSNNAPISVPADHLIHDEVDFSDPDTISKYQSRLTHSLYKRKTLLSTPTFPGFGIDAEFLTSRRHYNFVKCCHCNHLFIPDYFEHVHIPGYTGDVREITKKNIERLRWREAELLCPRCGKSPDLNIGFRQYVCENIHQNYDAAGYQVSPFDAPNIHLRDKNNPMSVQAFLIQASTNYKKYTDFINFNLGLPAEDADSTFTEDDIQRMLVSAELGTDGNYVFGIDAGTYCHLTVMKIDDDKLVIVHVEAIHYTKLQERVADLRAVYFPRVTIMDNMPYRETVVRMQMVDDRMYGAWSRSFDSLELYKIKEIEEDDEEMIQQVRQLTINRDMAFDEVLAEARAGTILKVSCSQDAEWGKQLQDMKRGKTYSKTGELIAQWKKSAEGNDHYHHSLIFAYVAAKMARLTYTGSAMRPAIWTFRRT